MHRPKRLTRQERYLAAELDTPPALRVGLDGSPIVAFKPDPARRRPEVNTPRSSQELMTTLLQKMQEKGGTSTAHFLRLKNKLRGDRRPGEQGELSAPRLRRELQRNFNLVVSEEEARLLGAELSSTGFNQVGFSTKLLKQDFTRKPWYERPGYHGLQGDKNVRAFRCDGAARGQRRRTAAPNTLRRTRARRRVPPAPAPAPTCDPPPHPGGTIEATSWS